MHALACRPRALTELGERFLQLCCSAAQLRSLVDERLSGQTATWDALCRQESSRDLPACLHLHACLHPGVTWDALCRQEEEVWRSTRSRLPRGVRVWALPWVDGVLYNAAGEADPQLQDSPHVPCMHPGVT